MMKTLLPLFAVVFLVGCRTAGPQIMFRDCKECRVDIRDSRTEAEQGKTLDGTASAAASLAATLRDITASQSGPATGGSKTGEGGANAVAAIDTPKPDSDQIRDATKKVDTNSPDVATDKPQEPGEVETGGD